MVWQTTVQLVLLEELIGALIVEDERNDMEDLGITLNNSVKMPALGLGVLQSEGSEATAAVSTALKVGYRLIDTAAAYFNEREVGRGIRDSGVDRADIFLTTKLWMTDYGYESTVRAFDTSTAKLGVDYVDLYLLHWPWPASASQTLEAFRAAQRLLAEGRARAIGVANFKAEHLRWLIREAEVVEPPRVQWRLWGVPGRFSAGPRTRPAE